MLRKTTADAAARPGFTLVELLVVMAIIVVLLSLVVGGIVGLINTQQQATTEDMFRTVDSKLRQHWNYVVAQAKKETPMPAVFALAGQGQTPAIPNVAERAQVIHVKLRLMQAFPQSFLDVQNPPYAGLLPDNRYTATYAKAIRPMPAGPVDMSKHQGVTEKSALLVLALSIARPNQESVLKLDSLSSGNRADTDQDGLVEIVDTWGSPIQFERFPTVSTLNASIITDLNNQVPQTASPGATPNGVVNDPLDPKGTLQAPAWYNSKLRTAYETILTGNVPGFNDPQYGSVPQYAYQITGYYSAPTMYSAGPDRQFVTTDDLFSFRLRIGGHGD
jgi:prepilin-type N-terminal cleavage/methylation domain-containing protein